MKKIVTAAIAGVLCLSSFGAGYILKKPAPKTTNSVEDMSAKYPLLARRIFLEDPNDTIINFAKLREDLNTYMNNNNLKGSLYFEYLPTGTSIRIGDEEEQVAASLMKIPVVMELYRAAENGRIDLDKKISLKREWLDDAYGQLYKKGVGYELTLREAAKIALAESDNTAILAIIESTKNLLNQNEDVISSLDISFERDEKLSLIITARSYSSFLKCLYFSCYLSKDNSEQILDYLTQSVFDNRLRAGVPESTRIAHKIGTFSDLTQSDCGIIYEVKRNYLLCVMLQVPDSKGGNAHIATISAKVYDYIQNSESLTVK